MNACRILSNTFLPRGSRDLGLFSWPLEAWNVVWKANSTSPSCAELPCFLEHAYLIFDQQDGTWSLALEKRKDSMLEI